MGKRFCKFGWWHLWWLLLSPAIFAYDAVEFTGLQRTDESWLRSYLNLVCPCDFEEGELARIKRELLTLRIFKAVSFAARDQTLVIRVEEKWTLIPVVRGEFGGGTPLWVLGAYDTNAFGNYTTLGAETRKYGNAPQSYVAYLRLPKFDLNKYFGAEIWRLNRSYDFVDGAQKFYHDKFRIKFMAPVAGFSLGIDVTSIFDRIRLSTEWQPTLVAEVDALEAENVQYDGVKFTQRLGAIINSGTHALLESQVFYYKLFGDLNFASSVFVAASTSSSMGSRYVIGGFDAVRGYPASAMHGSKAYVGNLELRYLLRSFEYLWLQPTAFYDVGSAFFDKPGRTLQSYGLGVRFSVPQVYRLVIRFDVALASGALGLSVGMNELFQPHRPL